MLDKTMQTDIFLEKMQKIAALQSGEAFLKEFVLIAVRILEADYFFIGRLEGKTKDETIATRFLAGSDGMLPNFSYEMAGTPCNVAIKDSFCAYPTAARILFPTDFLLTEMGIEGYIGLGLYDAADGKPLGIVTALYKNGIQNIALAEKIMRVFSSRVASELLREKSEERLRKSEEKYKALVENAGIGILKTSLDGKVLESNAFIQNLLGYSEQELSQMTFREFVTASELQKNIGELYGLIKNKKKAASFHTVLLLKTGQHKYVDVFISTVFDKGQPDYLIVSLTDRSEEHERQEAIKKLGWIENNYQALYRAIPAGIISINLEGKILLSNEMACQMLGYEDMELDGKPLEIILPTAIKSATHQKFVGMFFRDKETRLMGKDKRVIYARKKDGSMLPVEITLSYGKNESGEFAVAALKDVSEKEKTEKALHTLHEKEMLMKEIHHRVKNNMQVISSLLQLQSIKSGGDKGMHAASQNRIMAMALVHEQLYNSDELSLVKADQYVAELIGHLQSIAGRDDIDVKTEVGSFSLDIDVAVPCGLIINEVVSNSFKHAFPDGRKGNIGLEFLMKDDKFLLKIWDDGIGFDRKTPQTGSKSLGLTLINNLPKQIKAKTEIFSEPGKGASYLFTF